MFFDRLWNNNFNLWLCYILQIHETPMITKIMNHYASAYHIISTIKSVPKYIWVFNNYVVFLLVHCIYSYHSLLVFIVLSLYSCIRSLHDIVKYGMGRCLRAILLLKFLRDLAFSTTKSYDCICGSYSQERILSPESVHVWSDESQPKWYVINSFFIISSSADLEVQLVQLNHCDGEYSNY